MVATIQDSVKRKELTRYRHADTRSVSHPVHVYPANGSLVPIVQETGWASELKSKAMQALEGRGDIAANHS
jgi:hypothetical protein